ncbi:hypothetical protein [Catenuloplanes indicus]|uniref:Uncharacterized protein n=1 Tax=Catenuloplanes indicus TaxID=137267 RepID=A0AAE3VXJ7_9ACTN|nr:hypothetical protein [Catenuloplanes indicus]MDQ0365427.1 hypothetical protein [Catenuloplanes indicus]
MRSHGVNTDLWRHIRSYAVPPSMITSAGARRRAGDWAGACAAARADVDCDLLEITRAHGADLAAEIRADLRHLAPDLLRWHLPRIAPDGLLRPALTIGLARYRSASGPVWLVARTAPAWADAGQRISLAVWPGGHTGRHPHPHPHRRFRLDLHRHLWDTRHAPDLRTRAGLPATPPPPAASRTAEPAGTAVVPDDVIAAVGGVPAAADGGPALCGGVRTAAALPGGPAPLAVGGIESFDPGLPDRLRARGCAVDRWAVEAAILLRAEGLGADGAVAIRAGARARLVLQLAAGAPPRLTEGDGRGLPVLPDAAVWEPPDLALLRADLITPAELHPLVAAALVPGRVPDVPVCGATADSSRVRVVRCRGADHRVGLVDGVLRPLDHDEVELRREETLAALTGTPLPCLRVIDELHRHPAGLDDVRARLDHGDTEGALRGIEDLLGPAAVLPGGPLRDELAAAVEQRALHARYRTAPGPADLGDPTHQTRPRSDWRRADDPARSRHRPRRRRR